MFLVLSLIVIAVLSYIILHHVAPYAILQPQKINESLTPQQLGLNSKELKVIAEDGIELNGYWLESATDTTKGYMILIHGVGGCKEHFLGLAQDLAHRGIASVVFDLRAHGTSGGQYCTYGAKEKKDIAQIVSAIQKRAPGLPIGIWGNSLGGAIALQSLEYDQRIAFGVIESTFTDLSQIVIDYKKRILKGIGSKLVSDYVLKRAGEIGDFDPFKIKPINAVKNIQQPVFIAHGDADKNISYRYGQQLFKNLKTADKEFYLVEGGEHFGLFNQGGDAYKSKLMAFIDRNLK